MNKKWIFIIIVLTLIIALSPFYFETTVERNQLPEKNEEVIIEDEMAVETEKKEEVPEETDTTIITEIPIESVIGITPAEAEELCYKALGKEDKETGNLFSFGVSGAVERNKVQYFVIRASWLVNNSHMSYIGDFFVLANGKEIYTGLALHGEYKIDNLVWSE